MAPACIGLDSRILQDLKTRALHLVRSSRNPKRCLQVMRARAVAFFDSGDLGVVGKEESVEKERDLVDRLESAPPLSMAISERESIAELVVEPPVEDVVADENCSGFGSVVKIVSHLNVESKSFTITGCTGGDGQGLSTCQDNISLLMDIRCEQNSRQSEEFWWQVKYPIIIFTFDPGVVPYPSTPPLMPLGMRNEKFGKALGVYLRHVFKVDVEQDSKRGPWQVWVVKGSAVHATNEGFVRDKRQMVSLVFDSLSHPVDRSADSAEVRSRRDQ